MPSGADTHAYVPMCKQKQFQETSLTTQQTHTQTRRQTDRHADRQTDTNKHIYLKHSLVLYYYINHFEG